MANKKRNDWKTKAQKLEKICKAQAEQLSLMDQGLNDARENLDRVNGNADRWKAEAKEAQAELAVVQSEAEEVVEERDDYKARLQSTNGELDNVNASLERYRAALSENSNKIAHLAEEGLIEAAEQRPINDQASQIRLIGRLEGHLRGIINATGCKHMVSRNEDRRPLDADVRRAREHGSVQYNHRNDGKGYAQRLYADD